ncbi:hypothetical protein VSR82_03290 [Burkholderia sp. JPY481]|uniref:hypothetical protein n=1 Tax=unclassified Paraburkholderia TaxID=2615204 RepID=UPI0031758AE1
MIDSDKESTLIHYSKTRGASIERDVSDELSGARPHFIASVIFRAPPGDLRQPLGPANVLQ